MTQSLSLPPFSSLSLAEPILKALAEEGYTTPTPIQAKAIPPVLEGRDILGCAQTGTGKTAAFALPILHRLMNAPVDKTRRGPSLPRVLVLSPTRELATQIGDSFATYGRHTGLTGTVIFGGVSQLHQVRALQRGVDIVVATPGRLIDLMEQRVINLSAVEVFVLDEADRMLDMGFIQPIRRIAAAIPAKRQTLLFSATMPKEIMHLADSLLKKPVKVAVTPIASAAPLIEQSVYMIQRTHKGALLEHLLENEVVSRALVFTRTKHGADRLSRRLNAAGVRSEAIHGNKAQNQRQRALDQFRNGRSRVLVATDVAARGLDVDGITHVFNFDLPNEPEAYIHRIGRTGRAGATGIAISFCDAEERGLLRDIERLTGRRINASSAPAEFKPVHAASNADADSRSGDSRGRSARPFAPKGHRPSHQPAGAGHHRAESRTRGGQPGQHATARTTAAAGRGDHASPKPRPHASGWKGKPKKR